MSKRTLSRRLASSVVDDLKASGHVLVVKGGATALARELEHLCERFARQLLAHDWRRGEAGDAADEPPREASADALIDELVTLLVASIMHSDHVEDVFAEDTAIERDIGRALRGELGSSQRDGDAGSTDDEVELRVRLASLGYVASTAARRASEPQALEALRRAASQARAHLVSHDLGALEATFVVTSGAVDVRLELEQALENELAALVEQRLVELPFVEHSVELARAVPPREQRALGPKVDELLRQTGCAASWSFAEGRILAVRLTPLSERGSAEAARMAGPLGRGLRALFGGAADEPVAEVEAPSSVAPRTTRRAAVPARKRAAEPAGAAPVAPPPKSSASRPRSLKKPAAVDSSSSGESGSGPVTRRRRTKAEEPKAPMRVKKAR